MLRETLFVWPRGRVPVHIIVLNRFQTIARESNGSNQAGKAASSVDSMYSETTAEVVFTASSKRAQLGTISTEPYPQLYPRLDLQSSLGMYEYLRMTKY